MPVATPPQRSTAMHELGYDMRQHYPKGLTSLPDIEFDVAVTMGCEDKTLAVRAKHREDWSIPVPKWMPLEQFRAVRDQIKERVEGLIARLDNAQTVKYVCR